MLPFISVFYHLLRKLELPPRARPPSCAVLGSIFLSPNNRARGGGLYPVTTCNYEGAKSTRDISARLGGKHVLDEGFDWH